MIDNSFPKTPAEKYIAVYITNYPNAGPPLYSNATLIKVMRYINWEYKEYLEAAGNPMWIAQCGLSRTTSCNIGRITNTTFETYPIDRLLLGTDYYVEAEEFDLGDLSHISSALCRFIVNYGMNIVPPYETNPVIWLDRTGKEVNVKPHSRDFTKLGVIYYPNEENRRVVYVNGFNMLYPEEIAKYKEEKEIEEKELKKTLRSISRKSAQIRYEDE